MIPGSKPTPGALSYLDSTDQLCKTTPIDACRQSFEDATHLACRVMATVEKLVGLDDASQDGVTGRTAVKGLLFETETQAQGASDLCRQANAALDRLQRYLP